MTDQRHAEIRQMLEARRDALQGQMQQRMRELRDTSSEGTARPPADLSDEPAHEDLAFAFVEMQAQTLKNITAALVRLGAGDYGICQECKEEIRRIVSARCPSQPPASRARGALRVSGFAAAAQVSLGPTWAVSSDESGWLETRRLARPSPHRRRS